MKLVINEIVSVELDNLQKLEVLRAMETGAFSGSRAFELDIIDNDSSSDWDFFVLVTDFPELHSLALLELSGQANVDVPYFNLISLRYGNANIILVETQLELDNIIKATKLLKAMGIMGVFKKRLGKDKRVELFRLLSDRGTNVTRDFSSHKFNMFADSTFLIDEIVKKQDDEIVKEDESEPETFDILAVDSDEPKEGSYMKQIAYAIDENDKIVSHSWHSRNRLKFEDKMNKDYKYWSYDEVNVIYKRSMDKIAEYERLIRVYENHNEMNYSIIDNYKVTNSIKEIVLGEIKTNECYIAEFYEKIDNAIGENL